MKNHKPYCYDYPRHAVAADIIVLTKKESRLHILLIKRKNYPFAGKFAFPGGFVDPGESTDEAAARELKEETAVSSDALQQFRVYSEAGRDPRGRIISVVYSVFIEELTEYAAGDDAAEAQLFDIEKLPALAFDHNKILAEYFEENSPIQL
ncbi:MAG: NUDIX hydrolase [Bacteroidota bacterium]|nr:NUDIX hydrolase [Bacteroidota bacterium]